MALRSTTLFTLDQLKTWCKVTPGQSKSVDALVYSAGVVTAIARNHAFRHGDTVVIAGASPAGFNGSFAISLVDADTFTYPLSVAPTPTTASGEISARSDQDAVITLIGDRVSELLERATNRVFKLRTGVTETRDGEGRRSLFTKWFPIANVSVTVDSTALDADEYVVTADVGQIRRKVGVFPSGAGLVELVYDAGYAVADLPANVIGTGLDVCKYFFGRQALDGVISSSIAVAGSNVSIVTDLPRDLRRAIEELRDTRFG